MVSLARVRIICFCAFFLAAIPSFSQTCTPPGLYCNNGTKSTTPIKQNNAFFNLNLTGTQSTMLTNMLSANSTHLTGVVLVLSPQGVRPRADLRSHIDYGQETYGSGYCPLPDFTQLDSSGKFCLCGQFCRSEA